MHGYLCLLVCLVCIYLYTLKIDVLSPFSIFLLVSVSDFVFLCLKTVFICVLSVVFGCGCVGALRILICGVVGAFLFDVSFRCVHDQWRFYFSLVISEI